MRSEIGKETTDIAGDKAEEKTREEIEIAEDEEKETSERVEIDPMLAIYLEEFSELVEAFDKSTRLLIENPDDSNVVAEAERQLHTIKGGARMTGLSAVGDLSHAGESLLNLVSKGSITADVHLLDKLQVVSDELFSMYELASTGAEIKPAKSLIDELNQLSAETQGGFVEEGSTIDNDRSREGQSEEQLSDDSFVDASVDVSVDVRDPMVSIYLEELSELNLAFEDSTVKLIENVKDTNALADAERQLHTIKGGARMTGLTAIADLSHAGESLLNLVAQDKIEVAVNANEGLLYSLQQVSDALSKMYDQVAQGQEVTPENDLITRLNRLAGHDVEERSDNNDLGLSGGNQDRVSQFVQSTDLENDNPEEAAEIEQIPKSKSTRELPDFKKAVKHRSELEETLEGIAEEFNAGQFLPAKMLSHSKEEKKENQFSSSIRVPIGLVNQLIESTNEWGHKHISQVGQYEKSGEVVSELKRTGARLQEQIRNFELEADKLINTGGSASTFPQLKNTKTGKGNFDSLEMDVYTEIQQNSRALAESMNDLMSLSEALETGLKNAERTGESQGKIFKSIQEDLISTRMTKVTGLLTRLKRIVRQISSELGKDVVLDIADENCEMDRTILERITSSLEHLIRNSLAHGIEKPSERERVGKSRQGTITLKIEREGSEIIITIEDDGAGINVDKLKKLSIKKGLIDADMLLTDKDVYQLILMSGVSTADTVSQVAGRGVGMDVVNSEINALGGNIVIDSEYGNFTKFKLSVPYNLATNQVMFMDVAGEMLAVPVSKLEGMQRISAEQVNRSHSQENPTIECAGKTYFLRYLGKTLGLDRRCGKRDVKTSVPAILLEENGQRVAYLVEEIRGNREVMLKPLGTLFEGSRLLSSASILGGGEIVLLLNVHELIRLGVGGKTMGMQRTEKVARKMKKIIMVVDDSITVRKITENLLLSLNYSVATATDGINAMEILDDEKPDLLLLDIEMPRMDGFELLENMRESERWADIPVIMISSRSGAKHRKHAETLGANGFIGKPWEAKQLELEITNCLGGLKKKVLV